MAASSGSSSSGLGPRRPPWTERAQAWGAISAALIALVAVALSARALALQSEATTSQNNAIIDQLQLNQELRAERQAEYAARVSWWWEGDRRLHLQNRSLVPIKDAVVYFRIVLNPPEGMTFFDDAPISEGSNIITLGLTPPCTIRIFDGNEIESEQEGWIRGDSAVDGDKAVVAIDHIAFEDVNGVWSVELGGPPSRLDAESKPQAGEGSFFAQPLATEPASDCGSG
jgi:hypothetical protein